SQRPLASRHPARPPRTATVPSLPSKVELPALVALFYDAPSELGEFERVSAHSVPHPYRDLLVHSHHMTVTVEKFHASSVDVQVLEAKSVRNYYSRRILLTRQSDERIVQFGIVRLNFDFLGPQVRREIENQSTPLGRILIRHKVLREIEL